MQPTLAPAPPPMRTAPPDSASDQSLREHLSDFVQSHVPHFQQPRPDSHLSAPGPNPHSHNIDPAIAAAGVLAAATSPQSSGADDSPDKRGKRELTNTKRAAQNRQAQRAFRARKETHIKALETQVREFDTLSLAHQKLQNENHDLRQYIVALQSRLLDVTGQFPPPPTNIDMDSHRDGVQAHPSTNTTSPYGQGAAGSSAPGSDNVTAPTAPMHHSLSSGADDQSRGAYVVDPAVTGSKHHATGSHSPLPPPGQKQQKLGGAGRRHDSPPPPAGATSR